MTKKIKHILIAILLLVVVIVGYGWYQNQNLDKGSKTIELVIQVDGSPI